MAPRERKLAALFAGAVVLCLAVLIARGIAGGLTDLSEKNDKKREALRALAVHRATAGAKKSDIVIPETPLKLSGHVDGIIGEVGIESPSYPQPKEKKVGDYIEYSMTLKLPKLSISQLEAFLDKLESKTSSRVVVIRELHVKRNFRDKELLDVDLQIATFAKPSKKKGGGGDKEGSGDEG